MDYSFKESFYKNTSDTIVIFIHGITESPNQFKQLSKIVLKNGHSYFNMLLPGHGKTPKDFYENGFKEWISYVNLKLDNFRVIYENIIIVGHSMGCLLAINSYFYNKKKIKGLFFLSVPFNIKPKFNIILQSLILFFSIYKILNLKNRITIYKTISTGIPNIFQFVRWIPRYIDLFYLSYKVKYKIREIEVPTIYIQAYKDELVSIKSAQTIKNILKNFNKRKNKNIIIILKQSGHFNYSLKDKLIILNNFDKFLKYIV